MKKSLILVVLALLVTFASPTLSVALRDFTIPGSHDTGTYGSEASSSTSAQQVCPKCGAQLSEMFAYHICFPADFNTRTPENKVAK